MKILSLITRSTPPIITGNYLEKKQRFEKLLKPKKVRGINKIVLVAFVAVSFTYLAFSARRAQAEKG